MINYFNFKKFNDKYLITNDFGKYALLSPKAFEKLCCGEIDEDDDNYQQLHDNLFILDEFDAFQEDIIQPLREMKNYVFAGPSLHIFVMTNVCNTSCIYCQAKNKDSVQRGYMTIETGKKAVDIALSSPAKNMTFEFQGGEPLLNYKTIKAMIEYTEQVKGDKNVSFTLVSNLIALNDEMIEFFVLHDVNVSTSMDGPKELHNANRIAHNGISSFDAMEQGLKKLQDRNISSGAIETTTKYSLNYPEEIVDTYLNHGINSIFIRPLTPLGFAKADWDKIGYTAGEFLNFYKRVLKRIIDVNKSGIVFPELLATYFLKKILQNYSYNYMELRSPCGAVLGQLSYYYDGDIYTCDEGRMVAEMGDKAFKIGNVYKNNYEDLISNPVCKSLSISSIVEGLPTCSDCAYQPYCGVCPVITYASEKDIFAKKPGSHRCKVYSGILDILFSYIYGEDKEVIDIFKTWIDE